MTNNVHEIRPAIAVSAAYHKPLNIRSAYNLLLIRIL